MLRPLSERGCHRFGPDRFGSSVQGRPLEIWRPETGRIETLVVAGVHGEEPEGSVVVSRALRALRDRPPSCAVIVAANPDGLAWATRGNARGIDLNRNFPTVDWNPGPVTHRWVVEENSEVALSPGDAPASEPETRAFLDLLAEVRPRRVISVHAPLACIDDPAASPEGRWISEKTSLPLVDGVGYPTPGSFGTWADENDLAVITYELPRESVEHLVVQHVPVLTEIMAGQWPFG